jgi:hypothetical protein
MDLNRLLHWHQLSVINVTQSLSRRDQRAHEQFAREYAEEIGSVRAALGARSARPGFVT